MKDVSKTYAYLQTNNVTCHSFMDINRRHETSGSEIKNSLLLKQGQSIINFVLLDQGLVPTGWHEKGQIIPGPTMDSFIGEEPWALGTRTFYNEQ